LNSLKLYNEKEHRISEQKFRQNQQETRIKDIECLMEYIQTSEVKNIPSLDIKNLVSSGHSMGGTTAIELCRKFPDLFKYLL
jgi:surfactin synthase thioesterase subunit